MLELLNIFSLNQYLEERSNVSSSMVGEIFFILSLVTGIIFLLTRTKKKQSFKEHQEQVPDGKTLRSSYTYRERFHFFINPEFHYDKYHLAKGKMIIFFLIN